MASKLFVGGLPYETTQEDLLKFFGAAGKVFGVKLIMDRETGRSKGFGFVEMASEADAKAALEKLNGAMLGARKVFITEARPQEEKGERPAFAGKSAFAKPAFVPPPGFVERRSGKDRRQNPGFGSPAGAGAAPERRERPAFGDKKPWAKKPWEKKPWDKSAGDRKPWAGKEKKPWADKPAGERKPWGDKPKPWENKPAGERKPWGDKPKPWENKAAGEKKPWADKPAFGAKKPWAKPGAGGKKPWRKPEGKPGAFTRKAKRGSN